MKEGFTFNKVSLMFLRKVIFKNFGDGGALTEKSLALKLVVIDRFDWYVKKPNFTVFILSFKGFLSLLSFDYVQIYDDLSLDHFIYSTPRHFVLE